jgi:hypothetical protein
MERQIGLPAEGGIPEIGIALTVDTGGTANDVVAELRDEETAGVGFHNLLKELVVRYISLWLQPMVLAEKSDESLEVLFTLDLLSYHAFGIGVVDAFLHLLCDAFLRKPTME